MRMILEWKGKVYTVESCATCPARTTDTRGKVRCEIRNKQLRATLRGLFPGTNFSAGSVRCPVHPEVKGRIGRPPKFENVNADAIKNIQIEFQKIPLKEKLKVASVLNCVWCGHRINPMTGVIIINDKEPDRVYDKFSCLEEYIRTKDK